MGAAAYLGLSTDIPDVHFHTLVCYCVDVESDGRHCVHNLSQFEAVEDGGFASRIEAEHEDPLFRFEVEQCLEFGYKGSHGILMEI